MSFPAKKFRTSFKILQENITWYPGHMNHSFKHMQAIIRNVDCIVEVHDCRIPFSGRNPAFLKSLIGPKPHILVLNKKDLINKNNCSVIYETCKSEGCSNVVFTNCLNSNCEGLNSLVSRAFELIKGQSIYPRENLTYKMMIVGVPNVGKSSLINALRNITLAKGKASRIGAEAGITRAVQTGVKVSTNPLMYLIDTPGILPPKIHDVECGMKLALCACLKDSNVGVRNIADYLLYFMNKTENFNYVSHFGLKEPVDEILPVLLKIAVDGNKMKRIKNVVTNKMEILPDLDIAAKIMVNSFRKRLLGDTFLDQEYVKFSLCDKAF